MHFRGLLHRKTDNMDNARQEEIRAELSHYEKVHTNRNLRDYEIDKNVL